MREEGRRGERGGCSTKRLEVDKQPGLMIHEPCLSLSKYRIDYR